MYLVSINCRNRKTNLAIITVFVLHTGHFSTTANLTFGTVKYHFISRLTVIKEVANVAIILLEIKILLNIF